MSEDSSLITSFKNSIGLNQKQSNKNNNGSKKNNKSIESKNSNQVIKNSNSADKDESKEVGFLERLSNMASSKDPEPKITSEPEVNKNLGKSDGSAPDMPSLPSLPSLPSTETQESWFSFKNIFITLLILALLGFNLFKYFGTIVDKLRQVLKPLLSVLGYYVGETSKQTIDMAAEGSKYGIDQVTNATDSTIDLAEKGMGVKKPTKKTEKAKKVEKPTINESENQKKVINTINKKITEKQDKPVQIKPIETEENKVSSKGNWCFLGKEKNVRQCVEIRDSNNCISNELFPTEQLCINPTLRA